jgi:hypothetical protein
MTVQRPLRVILKQVQDDTALAKRFNQNAARPIPNQSLLKKYA